MKKFFTILASVLALGFATASAQEVDNTFQFQDAQGNVIADGSTITLNKYENGQISSGLFVKNISGEKVAGNVNFDLSQMPNGTFSSCVFGLCRTQEGATSSWDSTKGIKQADAPAEDMLTEWIPEPGKYASWTCTFQLVTREITQKVTKFGTKEEAGEITGYGPKITVNFVYSDPTGINSVGYDNSTVKEVYNVGGIQQKGLPHGLNIVRLANGKTVKVIK